jgi:glucose/arabinose dehydrogenase
MKKLILAAFILLASPVHPSQPELRYAELCAACHTSDPGASFRSSTLIRQGTDAEAASVIRLGRPARGMPAFANTLPEPDAQALAAWLRQQVSAADARASMIGQRIEAEALRVDRSAGFGRARDGDTHYLEFIDRGSHLCYDDIKLSGARSLEYRYAKGPGEPPRRFAVVAFEGDFVGSRRFVLGEKITELTEGWSRFRTERVGFSRELRGRYRLCIIGMGGGGVFNLDWFTLSEVPAGNDGITLNLEAANTELSAAGHRFRLEKLGEIDGEFWSLDFLDSGTLIATQKSGALWLFRDGQRIGPVSNTPRVYFAGQGGLFSVRAHPDYRRNRWIYLSYAEAQGEKSALTIVRGRIREQRWTDEQVIYREPRFFIESMAHFGARLAFADGYLYFGIGERAHEQYAQDPGNPFGKIHRLFDDGRLPTDNPFARMPGAVPTLWTLGHRNPQGLFYDARTRALWSTEHGPKGGDELNLILPGKNYGWPLATHGINYDGTPVSAHTELEGMEPPRRHWSPSPGLSNLVMYQGRAFPRWRHQLLVATLAQQQLKLIRLDRQQVVGEEIVLDGLGRIRDVIVGPDELPYVALNQPNGQIFKLVPVPAGARR